MNKISVIKILLIASIFLSSCNSYNVINVSKVQTSTFAKYPGIYYALPQTVITIDVNVTAKEYIKGPYAAFSNKFLGISNPITSNCVTYKITDIKLGYYVEPDPLNFYYVEIKNRLLKNKLFSFISLDEAGIIQSFNDINNFSYYQKKPDYINYLPSSNDESFIQYSGTNFIEKVDTLLEKVFQDTIIFEKQMLKSTYIEKTTEQKAIEAADFILKLHEYKVNLLSGLQEVPYSKEVMEYMINKLENMETEYLKLFTGYTKTSVFKYRYSYTPSQSLTDSIIIIPLFKFSPELGILNLDNSKGETASLKIVKNGANNILSNYLNNINNPSRKEKKLFYRIPENVKISLIINNEVKADAVMQVAQLGSIAKIPLNKNKIIFWNNTGAIKTISFSK